eukprot:CAMPEP_0202908168 /NCGR_PEP_ID=MMETSP1392-20130828/45122_1 /ASSEMBLY_ACC=CAM_ASM_000868 /TAXON_ID=225041 /ORGANISM="Chlamydomonas chlamydogama, Strain SAG 11-48b" /LENGTH=105 /DNA_ID=CAMNT_0049597357 /DNA_START=241 /DNA_END=558 /DNA_ORIENTATION=-
MSPQRQARPPAVQWHALVVHLGVVSVQEHLGRPQHGGHKCQLTHSQGRARYRMYCLYCQTCIAWEVHMVVALYCLSLWPTQQYKLCPQGGGAEGGGGLGLYKCTA